MAIDIIPQKKKLRILSEVLRKSWHFFAGLVLAVGYSMVILYLSKQIALLALTAALLIAMLFEHIRLEHRPKLLQIIDIMFRKKELNRPSAVLPFIMAGIIVFAVFPYPIAFVSIMMLIFGDAFSAGFGLIFGRKKIWKNKTYVGTLAGLIANLLTGFVIIHEYPMVFIPMALTATIVEMFTNKLDDNLTVPVSAAFAGYLFVSLFNMPIF
jgi:dolichol kinase